MTSRLPTHPVLGIARRVAGVEDDVRPEVAYVDGTDRAPPVTARSPEVVTRFTADVEVADLALRLEAYRPTDVRGESVVHRRVVGADPAAVGERDHRQVAVVRTGEQQQPVHLPEAARGLAAAELAVEVQHHPDPGRRRGRARPSAGEVSGSRTRGQTGYRFSARRPAAEAGGR